MPTERTFEEVLAEAAKEYTGMRAKIDQAVERFCRFHELDAEALKTLGNIVNAAESLGQQAGYADGMTDGRRIHNLLSPGARHGNNNTSVSDHHGQAGQADGHPS